jgi:hypothetical protein
MLTNPFLVYLFSFCAVLGIYQLDWSEIYPSLSYNLLLFFGLTFIVALLLARLVRPIVASTGSYRPGLLTKYAGLFVVATFAIELVLSGGIPLYLIIKGVSFQEIERNATHLHVFTLWSVYSTIRFADFLYSKSRFYLLEASLPVIFYALLVYRGAAMMTLVSWAFIFIIKNNGLKLKHITVVVIAAVCVFYLNGRIGDIRAPGDDVKGGQPTVAFRESGIPRTFFWTYLYSTVGLANLQLSVDKIQSNKGTVAEFMVSELIPDTFSRRIMPYVNPRVTSNEGNFITRDMLYSWEQPQVGPGMNISTIFGRSYGYFGWTGPAIMFALLSTFIVVYLMVISRSPFRVPCLALLNTLVLFCLFNNMLVSAAIIPQLVWPLLLPPWGWWKLKPFAAQQQT